MDERARAILFSTFWSKQGWLPTRNEPEPEDFAYAKSKGYMFDPIDIGHDETVQWLLREVRSADRSKIRRAFVASLGTRRLDQRSALGSLGYASTFPNHRLSSVPTTSVEPEGVCCDSCGFIEKPERPLVDLNLLSFTRHRWGGVYHDDPLYAAFDLERFRIEHCITPTTEDFHKMEAILDVAATMRADDRPNALEKALTRVFRSNKDERRALISILGFCGILQPRNKSGYYGEFTIAADRDGPDDHKNDWPYPVMWWRGRDGVNTAAIKEFFPEIA